MRVNGEPYQGGDPLPRTLEELAARLEVDAASVVAEVDGRVIRRSDFARTPLAESSVVELVRFVGGG